MREEIAMRIGLTESRVQVSKNSKNGKYIYLRKTKNFRNKKMLTDCSNSRSNRFQPEHKSVFIILRK